MIHNFLQEQKTYRINDHKKALSVPSYKHKYKKPQGKREVHKFQLNINTPTLITTNNNKLNSNIKKIVNVYKLKYTNSDSSGFGDFIRGYYFLLEFCEKHMINLDVYIYDSYIKNYLKYFKDKPEIAIPILDSISRFNDINCIFTSVNGKIDYTLCDDKKELFIDYLNL